MLDTFVLPSLAASSLCWSAINLWRHRTATATGAAALGVVTGLGWLASELNLSAWQEGGFGMGILTIVGGYSLGSALAHRQSKSEGAFKATFISAGLLIVLAVGLYQHAFLVPDEVLRGADPETRQAILDAVRGEALRLIQLATALLVAIGFTFARPPRQRLEHLSAEAVAAR